MVTVAIFCIAFSLGVFCNIVINLIKLCIDKCIDLYFDWKERKAQKKAVPLSSLKGTPEYDHAADALRYSMVGEKQMELYNLRNNNQFTRDEIISDDAIKNFPAGVDKLRKGWVDVNTKIDALPNRNAGSYSTGGDMDPDFKKRMRDAIIETQRVMDSAKPIPRFKHGTETVNGKAIVNEQGREWFEECNEIPKDLPKGEPVCRVYGSLLLPGRPFFMGNFITLGLYETSC